jgi:hypothetical protein
VSKRPRIRSTVGEVEDELPVEEVASRLGVPVGMLVRRIEDGTVPGRRLEGPDGVLYRVAASVLPPTPEGADALPGAEADGEVWSELAAPVRDGTETGGDSRAKREPAHPSPPLTGQIIETLGRHVNGDAQTHGAVPLDYAPRPGELARDGVVGPGIDARELVAALLDRWERTFEQRVHAEYQLRYDNKLADERACQLRLRGEIDVLRSELSALSQARDNDIGTARRIIADRDRDLAALREQLHTRLAAILERDRLIAERDRLISARDRLVHQLRDEVGLKDRLLGDIREQALRAPKQGRRRGGLFGS